MESPIEALIAQEEPGNIETWIRCFTALARVKKLKDEKATGGENKIMCLFLTTADSEAVKKILTFS